MNVITVILSLYFSCSIFSFVLIWKALEGDYDGFYDLPRAKRIICRLLAILLWPVYVVPWLIMVIGESLRWLYEKTVE